MTEKHSILSGKVHVYKRLGSPVWQSSVYLDGKNHRVSTKATSLAAAKEFAEDWFFGLREKKRNGESLGEKTFQHAAELFKAEYEALTDGERNPVWVQDHHRRIDKHLAPFFGKMVYPPLRLVPFRIIGSTVSERKKARGYPPEVRSITKWSRCAWL